MASPDPQDPKYKVQSLERGLRLLRELRTANAPVRNQELVSRTGLPKATVSRLLSTLGALGYVRRSDGGSYVLAQGSGRSGHAMLGALRLEDYHALFREAPGTVYLEAWVGGVLLPVYRWSATCKGTLTHGAPALAGLARRGRALGEDDAWEAEEGVWWAWVAVDLGTVGDFVLTSRVNREAAPDPGERAGVLAMLRQAAHALQRNQEASRMSGQQPPEAAMESEALSPAAGGPPGASFQYGSPFMGRRS